MIDPKKPDKMFLLQKQNYNNTVNIGSIHSGMYKLPAILETEAESKLFLENQSTPLFKTQVVHEPVMTMIHDGNDK